jgi:hypothetical protein
MAWRLGASACRRRSWQTQRFNRSGREWANARKASGVWPGAFGCGHGVACPLPPLVGGVALAGGIVRVLVGARRG